MTQQNIFKLGIAITAIGAVTAIAGAVTNFGSLPSDPQKHKRAVAMGTTGLVILAVGAILTIKHAPTSWSVTPKKLIHKIK